MPNGSQAALSPGGTIQASFHPVFSTLSAEKFTASMKPASASVYPGENVNAGVAGDFDKAYLPRPIERSTHSGRPLLAGETPLPRPPALGAETFHQTVSSAWPSQDETYEKAYMVPQYAPAFPLEANMDPMRMRSGFIVAPDIPTVTLAEKPQSAWCGQGESIVFPPGSPTRKLTGSPSGFADAPFRSTWTSKESAPDGSQVRGAAREGMPRVPSGGRARCARAASR
jgi:hypothetical protein